MRIHLTISIFILLAYNSLAQLSDERKFQLDSVVSVMPSDVRKNLWRAHAVMDKYASNEEEKVWMFYGYLGTHFKYDMDRFREKSPPQYSPELTAWKGKGVCRDYARLFSALCAKSNIRCIDVVGRADISFIRKFISYCKLNFNPGLHAWNIVEYNAEWHLMDPTWTRVEKTDKLPNAKTKNAARVKIKRSSRQFYDVNPETMAKTHAPSFPGFYLMNKIPTYKSAFRRKPKIYSASLDYSAAVDSVFTSDFPALSPLLTRDSKSYSGKSFLYYYYIYELALPLIKPTRFQTYTLETYNNAEARMSRMSQFFLDNYGWRMFPSQTEKAILEIEKKRQKLKKAGKSNAGKTIRTASVQNTSPQ